MITCVHLIYINCFPTVIYSSLQNIFGQMVVIRSKSLITGLNLCSLLSGQDLSSAAKTKDFTSCFLCSKKETLIKEDLLVFLFMKVCETNL